MYGGRIERHHHLHDVVHLAAVVMKKRENHRRELGALGG
jgi:hypothetical protein